MSGLKTYRTARILLEGTEILHMLHKRQIPVQGQTIGPVEAFYALVA